MDDLQRAFAELTPSADSADLFHALQDIYDGLLGVELFTCSRFDMVAGKAERIYTSNPSAYPLTGLKDIVPNRWTETVIDARQPFLGRRIADLKDVFPDHEKIAAMGLGSAINAPVFVSNRFLGTVNLLHRDDHYSEQSLADLPKAQLATAIAFLSALL